MTTEEQRKIVRELGRLYPETKCFLDHGKDYELLFAVILSAQATDVSVNKATKSLFKAFPTLESFAKATPETIEPYIKSVGLSKTKSRHLVDAAKKLLSEHAGELPKDRKALMSLPGVGFKTSGVVLAELYDFPYIPVDTHVHRVSQRLGLVKKGLSPEETEKALERKLEGLHPIEFHRQLILFGRNVCTARNPRCMECPLKDLCRDWKQRKKGA